MVSLIPPAGSVAAGLFVLDSVLSRKPVLQRYGLHRFQVPKNKEQLFDELVKRLYIVIPANAGIQIYLILLDPGLRRGDARRKISTFYEAIIFGPNFIYHIANPQKLQPPFLSGG